MPKVVSATDVKNRLGSVVSWVLENQDEVIVESRGERTVVIMSYAEYEKAREMREKDRLRRAFERLQALRDEVRARNKDITTEEEALAVADEISREAMENILKARKAR